MLHRFGCLGDQLVEPGDNPAIEQVLALGLAGREVFSEQQVKRQDVFEQIDGLLLGFFNANFGKIDALSLHHRRTQEVIAQSVGAVGFEHDVRVRVVIQLLRHLLAVFGQDDAVDDDVFERRLFFERRAQYV